MEGEGCVKRPWCIDPSIDGARVQGCKYAPYSLRSGARTPSRLKPYPLAEDVCLPALQSEIPRKLEHPGKNAANDMVYFLEEALAHFDTEEKNRLLECAKGNNQYVRETEPLDDASSVGRYVLAEKVHVFMPVFQARVEGRSPSHEDMRSTHIELVDFLRNYEQKVAAKRGANAKPGSRELALHHQTELEIAGLLSRLMSAELFPYPAFSREECNSKYSTGNHDLYIINDSKKIPIQIKTSVCNHDYDDIVKVIVHKSITSIPRLAMNMAYLLLLGSSPQDIVANSSSLESEFTRMFSYENKCGISITMLLAEELEEGMRMDTRHRQLLNMMTTNVLSEIYLR